MDKLVRKGFFLNVVMLMILIVFGLWLPWLVSSNLPILIIVLIALLIMIGSPILLFQIFYYLLIERKK